MMRDIAVSREAEQYKRKIAKANEIPNIHGQKLIQQSLSDFERAGNKLIEFMGQMKGFIEKRSGVIHTHRHS